MNAPSKIDALVEEFATFVRAHGLEGEGDAMELLMVDHPTLDHEGRLWLTAFIERWDAAALEADFYAKQTVVEAPPDDDDFLTARFI